MKQFSKKVKSEHVYCPQSSRMLRMEIVCRRYGRTRKVRPGIHSTLETLTSKRRARDTNFHQHIYFITFCHKFSRARDTDFREKQQRKWGRTFAAQARCCPSHEPHVHVLPTILTMEIHWRVAQKRWAQEPIPRWASWWKGDPCPSDHDVLHRCQ